MKSARFRRSKLDVAPPPLRCAVQGSAPLRRLESNCSGVCGGKEVQEGIGKSAGEWHFTAGGKDKRWRRMTFPPDVLWRFNVNYKPKNQISSCRTSGEWRPQFN